MDEDEILEFKAGRLELHCREIELVQRAAQEPRRIMAPGRIYGGPDGTIRVTAYPESIPPIRYADLRPGVPIPEDRLWDLRADDRSGQRWSSERLYLDGLKFIRSWRPIDEPLWFLCREEVLIQPYRGSHFTGYIFRSLKIDPNAETERTMTRPSSWSGGGTMNIMRFLIGELQVDIRQEAEYTVLDVATDGVLPERFKRRFLEAVRFVFGRPLSWSATVHTVDTRRMTYLRGQPVHDRDTHFPQPIPNYVVGAGDWMSELLRRYYLHVIRDTSAGWHPLSIWWSEVLRAGSREMESLVLIAAVAVEGVTSAIIDAEEYPEGVSYVSKADAATWQLNTRSALKELECPERIRNRVDGVFTRMGGITTLDVLFRLQELGAVDKDLVSLWKDVRPGAAHGSAHKWASPEKIKRAADGLVTLLRQLTFWWIGYRGCYTALDPMPVGWRLREYRPDANTGIA